MFSYWRLPLPFGAFKAVGDCRRQGDFTFKHRCSGCDAAVAAKNGFQDVPAEVF
jgi:hypothetical protein